MELCLGQPRSGPLQESRFDPVSVGLWCGKRAHSQASWTNRDPSDLGALLVVKRPASERVDGPHAVRRGREQYVADQPEAADVLWVQPPDLPRRPERWCGLSGAWAAEIQRYDRRLWVLKPHDCQGAKRAADDAEQYVAVATVPGDPGAAARVQRDQRVAIGAQVEAVTQGERCVDLAIGGIKSPKSGPVAGVEPDGAVTALVDGGVWRGVDLVPDEATRHIDDAAPALGTGAWFEAADQALRLLGINRGAAKHQHTSGSHRDSQVAEVVWELCVPGFGEGGTGAPNQLRTGGGTGCGSAGHKRNEQKGTSRDCTRHGSLVILLGMRRVQSPQSLPALLCVLMTLPVVGLCGCADDLDPRQPQGAYLIFRQALFTQDAETAWSYLDAGTQAVFEDRAKALDDMSEDIVRFLPQVDQRLARKQTGAELLKAKQITDGKALFILLFTPAAVPVTPEIEVGTQISSVEVNDAEDEAIIVTESGQQYRLVVEEDGVWRVSSWRDLAVERTKWILDNQTALTQTVQDLIAEEKEEVDRIIDFLVKEGGAQKPPSP